MTRALAALAMGCLLLMAVPAAGSAQDSGTMPVLTNQPGGPNLNPAIDLFFQSYFLMQNDNDFDRTDPVYDANGRTVGVLATTFRPGLTFTPIDGITLRYVLEIGENVWSRNDLDDIDPNAEEQALVRHKEVWAQVVSPDERFGIRSGYQYFYDPTHLVLDRHMGAVTLFTQWNTGRVSVAAGQVPDTIYEGLAATNDADTRNDNNFEQDDFVFAAWGELLQDHVWQLNPGVFVRWDKTEVERPKTVVSALANVFWRHAEHGTLELDVVGQLGRHENAGLDNRDVDIMAGAAQLVLDYRFPVIGTRTAVLYFSGDDGDRYDQNDTGFEYSGWSKSRTMLLSENRLYDRYDNLDERAAAQKAGLVLADEEFSVRFADSLRCFAILGAGFTRDGANTDGETFLGGEGHLGVEFAPYDGHASFLLMGGGLLPGKAASQLQNEINRDSQDPIGSMQASMSLSF
ncbi:hypothetical protein KDL45_03045 [bacterium]|nr:hypothetical protein [bacterium]